MRGWILGALLTVAGAVQAADESALRRCKFPEPPQVPDGTQASESEMGQAGSAVRDYVAGIQNSLECLTEVEGELGDAITEEQQALVVALYNKGVDQMNAVAGNYNQQVQAFKSRAESDGD